MSAEIVEGDDERLYVITGTPQDGYSVHRVGPPITTYERKFEARRAIRMGEIKTSSAQPLGTPGFCAGTGVIIGHDRVDIAGVAICHYCGADVHTTRRRGLETPRYAIAAHHAPQAQGLA